MLAAFPVYGPIWEVAFEILFVAQAGVLVSIALLASIAIRSSPGSRASWRRPKKQGSHREDRGPWAPLAHARKPPDRDHRMGGQRVTSSGP
jgi:hypothetical protein